MIALYKFGGQQDASGTWDQKYAAEPAGDVAVYGQQPFVQTILRYLRVGQRVLDAGCGTGGLLRFLKQRGGDVTGVDASLTAIERLRRAAPDIPAQVASIEQLPFPDASFDAYLAIGSWEYPPEGPQQAAQEAARVLKPHGLAFIEVPHANSTRRLLYLPLKRLERVVRTRTPRFSHYLFRIREMHTLLRRAGFEILETQPHDLPEPTRHYGLWVDWPFLRARPAKPGPPRGASAKWGGRSRSGPRYELNALGRAKKRALNALSPWTISTGMFIVARRNDGG